MSFDKIDLDIDNDDDDEDNEEEIEDLDTDDDEIESIHESDDEYDETSQGPPALRSAYGPMLYPQLTKYELARIISTRATQIAEGAPPNVDTYDDSLQISLTEIKVALAEYYADKIPIDISRNILDRDSKKQVLCPSNKLIKCHNMMPIHDVKFL